MIARKARLAERRRLLLGALLIALAVAALIVTIAIGPAGGSGSLRMSRTFWLVEGPEGTTVLRARGSLNLREDQEFTGFVTAHVGLFTVNRIAGFIPIVEEGLTLTDARNTQIRWPPPEFDIDEATVRSVRQQIAAKIEADERMNRGPFRKRSSDWWQPPRRRILWLAGLQNLAPWTAFPLLAGGTIAFLRRSRTERAYIALRAARCPTCAYDLSKTPTRCPECGRDFPDDQALVIKTGV